MSSPKSVFISYASEDAGWAYQLSDALRARKLVVWLDKAELRGSVDWDNEIRRRIADCGYIIPLISPNTESRTNHLRERYFWLEWRLAAERALRMAIDEPFLIPLVISGVDAGKARVPEEFRRPQWTTVSDGDSLGSFADLVLAVVSGVSSTYIQKAAGRLASPAPTGGRSEAVALFARGCDAMQLQTKIGLASSVELFGRAIQADTGYEFAHAALAECHLAIAGNAYASSFEEIPKARVAAREALKLDPLMPSANVSAGICASVLDWDWREAERRCRLALDIDPLSPAAHFGLASNYLIPVGALPEAIDALDRACELQPEGLGYQAHRAGAYAISGDYVRAVEEAYRVYRSNPKFVSGRGWLCYTYYVAGQYEKIIMLCDNALHDPISQQNLLWPLGCAYAKTGQHANARQVIADYEAIRSSHHVASNWVAAIWMALGDYDQAFSEINKSLDARDWFIRYLNVDPFWTELRTDPRFGEAVSRLKLPG